jgi:hypothetical protein
MKKWERGIATGNELATMVHSGWPLLAGQPT